LVSIIVSVFRADDSPAELVAHHLISVKRRAENSYCMPLSCNICTWAWSIWRPDEGIGNKRWSEEAAHGTSVGLND